MVEYLSEVGFRFAIYEQTEAPGPTPWIRDNPLKPHPASQETQDKVHAWLQNCKNEHPGCGKFAAPGFLPTRLIDVGGLPEFQDPVLVATQKFNSSTAISYATLSHCWGSTVHLKTTSATLDEHERSIPFSTLNRTFRDAIEVTRSLGLQYLWIDSLCIIQDSEDDWAKEASQMAAIYKNGFVCIAACSACDGDQGFLNVRSLPCEVTSGTNPARAFWMRLPAIRPATERFSHLADRAWCFQEEILAPRTLYYSKDQVCFKCHSCSYQSEEDELDMKATFSENYTSTSPHLFLPKIQKGFVAPHYTSALSQATKVWHDLVEEYSTLKLTYSTDKLPAIAGLAAEFGKARGADYLAGLWKHDIPQGLCWQLGGNERRPTRASDGFMAPSWSWASQASSITYCTSSWRQTIWDAKLLESRINHIGGPYGKVTGGYLKMNGRLLSISLEFSGAMALARAVLENESSSDIGHFPLDDSELDRRGKFWAFLLGTEARTTNTCVLFLVEVVNKSNTYKRIGYKTIDPKNLEVKEEDMGEASSEKGTVYIAERNRHEGSSDEGENSDISNDIWKDLNVQHRDIILL